MKKIISFFIAFVVLCFAVGIKRCGEKDTIVIYTSTEDYNMTYMQECLDKQFPKYNIVIEYMSTSNIASKVIEEGSKCEADIVYAVEYGYLEKMASCGALGYFGERYDMSLYIDDMTPQSLNGYATPNLRSGGGIIINKTILANKGLEIPRSYEDLLNPCYKGLLSMPSPKTSGTGYMFYKSLVNAWGLEKALNYFDGFYKNICNNFTTSGSGPVNALISGEAGIGLGMISQAVEKISSGRDDLEIIFFEEGAPFSMYGSAVVKGKEQDLEVMEVMDYITNVFTNNSCKKYYPEPIFKNINYDILNFPQNIIYADMSNNNQFEKEKLLKSWSY